MYVVNTYLKQEKKNRKLEKQKITRSNIYGSIKWKYFTFAKVFLTVDNFENKSRSHIKIPHYNRLFNYKNIKF